MIDSANHYYAVDAWLEIDGEPCPIATLQFDYELNALPRATAVVPLGVDARTGVPSPAHLGLIRHGEIQRARAFVRLAPNRGAPTRTGAGPGEPVLVFDGFTAGIGAAKTKGPPASISLTVSLRHWLSELDYASVFSRWSHPANPWNFSSAAVITAAGAGETTQGSYGGPLDIHEAITRANVEEDLWESALKPFFLGLTETEGLEVRDAIDLDGEGLGARALSNEVAAAALRRIRSRPALKLTLGSDPDLAGKIQQDLRLILGGQEMVASSTFWDLLIQALAGEYLFAVSPRISDALVVPHLAAASGHHLTIGPEEAWAYQLGGENARPIRAYGILSAIRSDAGLVGGADERVAALAVGGWYKVPNLDHGVVRIVQSPRWAADLPPAARRAPNSGVDVAASAEHPDAGPDRRGAVDVLGGDAEKTLGFLSRYARARLVLENSLVRQGVLTGPLRLDAAPGTAVRIEVGDAVTGTAFHGVVLRASTVVSVSSRAASTTFHLGHLRTEAENARPGTSLTDHPLYETPFLGAPLYLDADLPDATGAGGDDGGAADEA